MINIPEWKKAKAEKDLTYLQLSEMTGIPRGTIQNIFAGYTPNPRIDTVRAIERALGLYNVPTDEERAAGVVEYVNIDVNALESELIDLFRELGARRGLEAQNIIISVLENMLK